MNTGIFSRGYGFATVVFGLAAVIVYLVMTRVTLAHLADASGVLPFDLRPLGYSPKDAAELLGGLGEAGRRYYLSRQIPLDTLYPALLALTLGSAMCWFGARLPKGRMVVTGISLSVLTAIADYTENLGVALMILGWPDVPDLLVRATSVASTTKAISTTAAVGILIVLAAKWCVRSRRT